MTDQVLHTILEYFPTTKWAEKKSRLLDSAIRALTKFDEPTVIIAITTAKKTLSRTFISVDELVLACKTVQYHEKNRASIAQAHLSDAEIRLAQDECARRIAKMSREQITEAVAHCRLNGALSGDAVSPQREQWSKWTKGMIHAASIALDQKV